MRKLAKRKKRQQKNGNKDYIKILTKIILLIVAVLKLIIAIKQLIN